MSVLAMIHTSRMLRSPGFGIANLDPCAAVYLRKVALLHQGWPQHAEHASCLVKRL